MPLPQDYLDQFTESAGYLDFARFGPPSRAVREASARLLERAATADHSTVDDLMRADADARSRAGRLCGISAEQVVLQPNTSTALFQAAFATGGVVLVSDGEFPANTYPWSRAAEAGRVEVRRLRPPDGLVTPEVVRAGLDAEVTTVAVSAVDFRTGHRADLAGIREVIGDRLLVVDGIQAFGVVEADWATADVLVAGGQKWLRAGWGTGFAALSPRALDRHRPLLSGWTGARDPGRFDGEVREPVPGAESWSLTNLSPVSAGALAAALDLVERAGVARIEARIAERVGELAEARRAAGARITSAAPPRSGILTFDVPGRPAREVAADLAAAGIAATGRAEHVRLSPHASTSADAVRQVAAVLRGR